MGRAYQSRFLTCPVTGNQCRYSAYCEPINDGLKVKQSFVSRPELHRLPEAVAEKIAGEFCSAAQIAVLGSYATGDALDPTEKRTARAAADYVLVARVHMV